MDQQRYKEERKEEKLKEIYSKINKKGVNMN